MVTTLDPRKASSKALSRLFNSGGSARLVSRWSHQSFCADRGFCLGEEYDLKKGQVHSRRCVTRGRRLSSLDLNFIPKTGDKL